jgi:hypothetical protein
MRKNLLVLLLGMLFSCSTKEDLSFEVIISAEQDTLIAYSTYKAGIFLKDSAKLNEQNYIVKDFYWEGYPLYKFPKDVGYLQFTTPRCLTKYPIENGIQKRTNKGSVIIISPSGKDTLIYFPINYYVVCK